MQPSSVAFHHALLRFQRIHRREDGVALDSFRNRNSYAHRAEGYKEALAMEAERMLRWRRWSRGQIGTGEILRAVIAVIELHDNNLVQWDARFGLRSRVHHRLHEALADRGPRREVEQVLFDLFHRRQLDEERFEHLAHLCGRRYELIAYLFFIADPRNFLPIRTTSFDRAFAELGLDLTTVRKCSWGNYQAFLAAMHGVCRALAAEGLIEVSLLDAHSFCWLLATDGRTSERRSPPRLRPRMRQFTGKARVGDDPARQTNREAPVVDMEALAARKTAAGRMAEEIAFEEEKRRLRDSRRPDLARQVKLVSDRPALGYDIESCETNGVPRYIEVKNLGEGRRFYLTRGEWLRSRELPNYWFYFVTASESLRPEVTAWSASNLKFEHLVAVQYVVNLGDGE